MLYIKHLLFVFLFLIHLSCGEDPASTKDQTDTVTDIDGNVYKTIKIGDQVWMTENLKVTRYTNGDTIPYLLIPSQWEDTNDGALCAFVDSKNNNQIDIDTYGLIYNGYIVAIDASRNIAPDGWHVPTDEEWKELEMQIGMFQVDADSTGWRGSLEGNGLKSATRMGGSNVVGFTALPGGYRDFRGLYGSNEVAYFWSSTVNGDGHLWMRSLGKSIATIGRFPLSKNYGASIRCVKD